MKRILLLAVFLLGCSKENIDIPEVIYNPYKSVTRVDYTLSSYYTRVPFPEQVTSYRTFSPWSPPLEAVVVDYDKDGYLDIVETQSEYGEYKRNKIVFLKGTSDGKLVLDPVNSSIYDGLIHGRKGLTGDFNNDGWPDIFFIGHGYDYFSGEYPNSEYPILLINNQGINFSYIPFYGVEGFFHTGASGDIDSDGDLDVILIDGVKGGLNSYVLLNSGDGTFDKRLLSAYDRFSSALLPRLQTKFTSELVDLDNDGDLDLVLAGHEFNELDTPSLVIFNSPQGFTSSYDLPVDEVYGIVNDIDFYDLDSDGKLEIIYTSTKGTPFYQGFKIRVYDLLGNDLTNSFFNLGNNLSDSGQWLYWMSFITKDEVVYFQGDDMYTKASWRLQGATFTKIR